MAKRKVDSLQSACEFLLYRTYLETWKKGEKYADEGRVQIKESDDKSVIALVTGTKLYETKIAFRGGGINRGCSCPVRDFCKQYIRNAQKFHYELVMGLIDDSDGLHEFTEAHLDKFYDLIKKNANQSKYKQSLLLRNKNEVKSLMKEFDTHRNDY